MGCVLHRCTDSSGYFTDRQIGLRKCLEDQYAFGIGKDLADISLLFCRLECLISRCVHLSRLLELSGFPIIRKDEGQIAKPLVNDATMCIGFINSLL